MKFRFGFGVGNPEKRPHSLSTGFSSDRLGTFIEYLQVGIVYIEFFTLAPRRFLRDSEFD